MSDSDAENEGLRRRLNDRDAEIDSLRRRLDDRDAEIERVRRNNAGGASDRRSDAGTAQTGQLHRTFTQLGRFGQKLSGSDKRPRR